MKKRKLRKPVKVIIGIIIVIPVLIVSLFIVNNFKSTHISSGNMNVEESFKDFINTSTDFNMAQKVNKQKEIIEVLNTKTYKVNRYTNVDKIPNGIYPFPYFYSTWFTKDIHINEITKEYINFDITLEEIGWQTSASPERGDVEIPDEFMYRTKAEDKTILNVKLFYRIKNGQVVFEIDKDFDNKLGQYCATWSHSNVAEVELEKYR